MQTIGQMGRIDEAQAAITKIMELRPELSIAFMTKRYATAMRDPFFDGLREAGLVLGVKRTKTARKPTSLPECRILGVERK